MNDFLTHLVVLALAARIVSGGTTSTFAPGFKSVPDSAGAATDLNNTYTDFPTIESAIVAIEQTSVTDGPPDSKLVHEADVPDGYELVFGPTGGANNAPGYMGFAFAHGYDACECAALCNERGADKVGGACQYFNIWQAMVKGAPTTTTCAFYYLPTDESTAVNHGSGNITVTYSRGYRRKSLVIDGGFEGYTCSDSRVFCYETYYSSWVGTSPHGGFQDATIFHYAPYARSGHGVALLGSAVNHDTLEGTLTPAKPLETVAGKKYTIEFFHSSTFSGPQAEEAAFVDVLWNGGIVATIKPGYSSWAVYQFTVTAVGKDILAFRGGKAPAWSFIDDVNVFAL